MTASLNAESDGERILKIGQHLAKLWARVGCPVFFTHGYIVGATVGTIQTMVGSTVRIICAISIETAAPLQTTAICEQIKCY